MFYMGVPVVNIGTRQNDRERGPNVIDVTNDRYSIKKAIQQHLNHGHYASSRIYGQGCSGQKAAEILANVLPPTHKKLTF